MIQFKCPSCKASLTAPAVRQVQKVLCTACGQKILIPMAPTANKTMLAELPAAPPVLPPEPPTAIDSSAGLAKWIIGIIAAVFAIVGIILLAVLVLGPSRSDRMIAEAKLAVASRLRAPSTAKFPPEAHYSVSQIGKQEVYSVRGEVDSQNGFGAMIRSLWTVSIEWGGKEPIVTDVKISAR